MTGAPAETWRKFRFSSPPPWAYALYVLVILGILGMIVAAALMSAVAQRASGFLPLTRGSRRLVGVAIWVPIGLMIGAVALWTVVPIGAVASIDATDPNAGTVAGLSLLLGALLLVVGLIGRLVVTPLVCPRARVTQPPGCYDKLVEIRNVHPAFVAAVNQIHQARAAQYAAVQA